MHFDGLMRKCLLYLKQPMHRQQQCHNIAAPPSLLRCAMLNPWSAASRLQAVLSQLKARLLLVDSASSCLGFIPEDAHKGVQHQALTVQPVAFLAADDG